MNIRPFAVGFFILPTLVQIDSKYTMLCMQAPKDLESGPSQPTIITIFAIREM